MLDSSGVKLSKTVQDEVKTTIREFLQKDGQYDKYGKAFESKCDLRPLHKALQKINNPQEALVSLRNNIAKLLVQLDLRIQEAKRTNPASAASAVHTCEATQDVADMLELDNGETLRLMHSRWEKLYTDLWSAKTEAFDMSKIPDIYDCCKYDAIHSQHSLGLTVLDEMYETARSLAEFVCPSEYGLSRSQRLKIGCTICRNLVEKIGRDMKGSVRNYLKALKENTDETSESDDDNTKLKFNPLYLDDVKQQEDDFVQDSIKTRLYFTSESHLHTVISALRFINVQGIAGDGGKAKKSKEIFDSDEQNAIENIPEFDYLTQIVFKVFEDTSAKLHSPQRFCVQIGLSPGVAGDAREKEGKGGKKHLDCQPVIWFPQTEGKVVTLTNLERTFKGIRDHVDKSRNQWVALEALSTRVEGEENADERAERIAFELMRDEEEAKVKQAIKQEVKKVLLQEEEAEKKEAKEADKDAS
eukprot:Tamp_00869.p1 GENE.Tamp_00869~~Tamp_00869.p1  ORF type:complete len:472 (+),score=150.05 Tamp_00869:2456-3871(+)